MSDQLTKLLKDADAIWEAIGPDGVRYPPHVLNDSLTASNPSSVLHLYDKELALNLGRLARRHQDASLKRQIMLDAAIGSVIRQQIIGHLTTIAEKEG